MIHEFQKVMGEKGPAHTTLIRYASGRVQRRHQTVERYVSEAIRRVAREFAEGELHESEKRRKHVETQLHEKEARFRQLIEHARDIIYRYRLRPNRGYEYISPSVVDVVGYTPEEHYDDPDLRLKIIHPDDREKLEKSFRGEGLFGEPMILRWVHKDGSLVWTEHINVPIYDDAGQVVALEGIARDITERKRTEEMLRENETRYQSLYNGTPAMLHSIDRNARFVSVSDYWLEVMGYERSDIIGQKVASFMTDASRRLAEEKGLPEFFRTGLVRDLPFQFVKQDGEIIDVLLSAIGERDHEGNIVRSLSILVDVTARKRTEAMLRESEERFRLAFEKAPIGMAIVDLDLKLLRINKALCEMLGYSEKELTGRTILEFTHPDDVDKGASLAEQVFKGEIPSYVREKRYITKHGETLWIRLTANVIRDEDGNALYGLNITQIKRTQPPVPSP